MCISPSCMGLGQIEKKKTAQLLFFLAKCLIHQTMDLASRSMKSMALLKGCSENSYFMELDYYRLLCNIPVLRSILYPLHSSSLWYHHSRLSQCRRPTWLLGRAMPGAIVVLWTPSSCTQNRRWPRSPPSPSHS